MSYIEIGEFIQLYPELKLRTLCDGEGLGRHLTSIDINRPGLTLTGYFKNFASKRIQVFGQGEYAYLEESRAAQKGIINTIIERFLQYEVPGLIFTHDNVPFQEMIEIAKRHKTAILITPLTTHAFILGYTRTMGEVLAPLTHLHGVLINVFGVGILLMGASGIGKSETTLELIERGHHFVADDIIQIRCINEKELYGIGSSLIQHNMELRGLGIINIKDLFGIGSVLARCAVDLVIGLEDWDESKNYERIGIDEKSVDILGVQVPRILLPIRPGRNIPILIETAAINHRSKKMGYDAARELNDRVSREIERKSKKEL